MPGTETEQSWPRAKAGREDISTPGSIRSAPPAAQQHGGDDPNHA